ncbi:hypothetical protein [Paucibacter sp. B51]|uniref:hypothetical protein n=1 Tax=Paucibacter sp. B51 TaxID=2993315 RepID=UPI0022EBBE53|nr:hypothetical protein [Paucibacter sp. B51]
MANRGPKIQFIRHGRRWCAWLAGGGALLAAGAWLWLQEPNGAVGAADAVAAPTSAHVATSASAGAPPALSPFWSLARDAEDRVLAEHYRQAGVATATPPPGSRISPEEWEARRVDARWCAEDGLRAGNGLSPWPGDSKSLSQAKSKQVDEAIRLLRTRSQPMFSAVAEWLQYRYAEDEAARGQAQENLQNLARSSRLPLAVFLALRAECVGGSVTCTRVPAALWAEVEPDNRLAWLAQLAETRQPQEQRRVLLRAAEAPRQFDYSRHVLHVLLSLPMSGSPGLRAASQVLLRADAAASEDLVGAPTPQHLCKTLRVRDAEVQRACTGLAEHLWRDSEDRQGHNLALALAADSAVDKLLWGERAQELKLVEDQDAFETVAGIKDLQRQALGCGGHQAQFQQLADYAAFGEWRYLQGRQVVRAQAEALEQAKKSQP